MKQTPIKKLKVGDTIELAEPEGAGRIISFQRSRLFNANGGCWRLDIKITDGEHKGEWIRDQHYPGDNEVMVI